MFQHKKTINKDKIKNQFQDFFRRIKLISKIRKIKISLLKKIDSINQQIKTGYSLTIIIAETFIEATRNKIKEKIEETRT